MMTIIKWLSLTWHVLASYIGVKVKLFNLTSAILNRIRQFQDAFAIFVVFLLFFAHFLIIWLLVVCSG